MYYQKNDIFEILSSRLYEQGAKINEIKPNTRLFEIFGIDASKRLQFYAWIKEHFAIDMWLTNFTTINSISEKIYKNLPAKYKQPVLQQTGAFQNTK